MNYLALVEVRCSGGAWSNGAEAVTVQATVYEPLPSSNEAPKVGGAPSLLLWSSGLGRVVVEQCGLAQAWRGQHMLWPGPRQSFVCQAVFHGMAVPWWAGLVSRVHWPVAGTERAGEPPWSRAALSCTLATSQPPTAHPSPPVGDLSRRPQGRAGGRGAREEHALPAERRRHAGRLCACQRERPARRGGRPAAGHRCGGGCWRPMRGVPAHRPAGLLPGGCACPLRPGCTCYMYTQIWFFLLPVWYCAASSAWLGRGGAFLVPDLACWLEGEVTSARALFCTAGPAT